MVNLKPLDRAFCKIYMEIGSARRLDRSYCKIYVAMVNMKAVHRRYCERLGIIKREAFG